VNPKLQELLEQREPAKCPRCEGSGVVTVQGREWLPQVCWCGSCGGTGRPRRDTLVSVQPLGRALTFSNFERGRHASAGALA
jgi:hypothetical protein